MVSKLGDIKYPSWVRDRVRELLVLRYELLIEELESSGVYGMSRDTFEDKVKRVVVASRAYMRAEKKWKEIVAKEPSEVRRALAETLLSLISLIYGHE